MSLGWQTESTLLKFKAKPIKVDDKSLLPLKAIISTSKDQQSSSSISSSSILRKKRGDTSQSNNFIDLFQKSKEGKKKQKQDDNNNNNNININESNKNTASILKAKADLYDQLKRGNIPSSGESFLINFEEKKILEDKYKSDNNNNNSNKQFNSILNNDKIEIIDEFGRSKFLLKSSEEYKDYLVSKDIKKRKEYIMVKHNEYNYEYISDKAINNDPSSNQSNSEWSWSKGNHNDKDLSNSSDYIEKIAIQKGYHSVLKDKIDNEIISNDYQSSLSNSSQVKSQWERTFDTDTKVLLSDIHNETSAIRAEFSKNIITTPAIETNNNNNNITSSLGSIISSTDERRELLRLKKENRKKIK
jgi:hypothetical protein